MPNGHPDFETKEKPLLELFFQPVASAMEKFANRHNLRLTKLFHTSNRFLAVFDGMAEVGNPKVEIRRPKEIRNPKSESPSHGLPRRHATGRFEGGPVPSGFGVRISFGFLPSDFGLGWRRFY
jgi:hypothetical protein